MRKWRKTTWRRRTPRCSNLESLRKQILRLLRSNSLIQNNLRKYDPLLFQTLASSRGLGIKILKLGLLDYQLWMNFNCKRLFQVQKPCHSSLKGMPSRHQVELCLSIFCCLNLQLQMDTLFSCMHPYLEPIHQPGPAVSTGIWATTQIRLWTTRTLTVKLWLLFMAVISQLILSQALSGPLRLRSQSQLLRPIWQVRLM